MLKIQNKIVKSVLIVIMRFDVFVLALLLAVLFRSLLFEPFHIPSGSMKPNLLVGDYIVVSKYKYGYSKYSFPFALPILGGNKRIFYEEPKRGDVVVFRLPRSPKINYIKRVIGLPGDTVKLKNGLLYINDIPVKMNKVNDFTESSNDYSVDCYLESLDNGSQHRILTRTLGRRHGDTELYKVPEGHFFVMGDNRDNSTDSRFLNDVGFIPMENLIGKAEVIVLSLSREGFFPLNLNVQRLWKYINYKESTI